MNGNRYQKNFTDRVVVASMLDWGLGHTTRCIPVLNEFVAKGFQVVIAGTDAQIKILMNEVRGATFMLLNGYNITYAPKTSHFALHILRQIPVILRTISFEKRWLKNFLRNANVQYPIVFSDNRPGFHHPKAHCIYMTHQLTIKTGNRLSGKVASLLHRYFIKKFDECWIPDTKDHTLAGTLAEDRNSIKAKQFIGPLSRFSYFRAPKKYDLAFVLSGPEPQRTLLEELILSQIKELPEKNMIIIRGVSSGPDLQIQLPPNVSQVNYLGSRGLNEIFCTSELIICRSGYSSIMDLVCAKAKALLIPTPGQGEQIYLAHRMVEKGFFMTADQSDLNLPEMIMAAHSFPFRKPCLEFDAFREVITELGQKYPGPDDNP